MAISAALYVVGESLKPANVTAFLGVDPTEAWSKGQAPTRTRLPRTNGGWVLRFHANDRDPGGALQRVLDELDDRVAQVHDVAGVEDAHFDLFMAQERGSPDDAFVELSPQTLAALHKSGLPLCLTFCGTDAKS